MRVEVKLLFFAKAREIVGTDQTTINFESTISYKELHRTIVELFALKDIEKTIILSVNAEYCTENDSLHLKEGDEIAVIPPLSEVSDLVSSPSCGATSIFVGTTRNNFEGKTVIKLEYECYEAMAMKSLRAICTEIRNQWPNTHSIAIYHRLGTVPVKEASIIIAISSPHRADAMSAVEWCINTVKQSVPIWKKEIFSDNSGEWKENKESLSKSHPPKFKPFKLTEPPEFKVPFVPPHLIQVKADSDEIERRIEKFIQRKRDEINQANIRDFCSRENNEMNEYSCARIDATLVKRKDSKGHLQVNRVLNTYHRDQGNLEYLKNYNINKNGIEERVVSVETQLSMDRPVNKNIYSRLREIEERLLHLESISPEYVQFWDKTRYTKKVTNKKRIFTIEEIDSFINNLERKKTKPTNQSDEDT
ncbi:hypothetical protein FQR65_LT07627 [Abscondita terminalis]|nr:hypothetical protein FQR65_LT07627 [Abscondita terminalis]